MIQHCPTPTELDDLELLVSGAYAPLTRFNEPGSPVTLDLPDGAEPRRELVDPEGLPLARVACRRRRSSRSTHAQYGPFRRLHLTPAQVARAARRRHVRAGRRRAHRGRARRAARPRPGRPGRADRHRHRRRSPPSRWSAPRSPRPTCSTTPHVVAVPLAVARRRRRRPRARRAGGRRPTPADDPVHALAEPSAGRRTYPAAHRGDRRRRPARARASRASCCSSPACPAAASRRWPAP